MLIMPPKPFSLYILGALAAGEAHTYAIAQQIGRDSRGAVTINSRRVYRDVARLEDDSLIETVPDTRPTRYRLTSTGRRTLAAERERALQTYRILQERLQ